MRGIDRERRQDREDPVVEDPGELRLRLGVEIGPRGEREADLLERGRDLLGERGRLPGDQLLDASPDRAELFDLVEAVGRRRAHADRELFLQARDSDLEELVDVAAEDREELRPFEQRNRRVLGEREDPGLEFEHRQFPVQVAGPVGRRADLRRAHDANRTGFASALLRGRARDAREPPGPVADAPYDGAYGHARPPRVDDVHAVRPARARPRGRARRRCLRHGVAGGFALLRRRGGRGPAQGPPLSRDHDGAVRGRRAGARPLPRPHPRRSAADGGALDDRAGRAVRPDGEQRSTARCCTRSRSARSSCRRVSRSRRARSSPPSSIRTTSWCSRTRGSRSSRCSAPRWPDPSRRSS